MLQFADRVQETTLTTGTSAYALNGAATDYQAFGSVCNNGDTCYYTATDGLNWEVGLGTYGSSGDTLARTTIFASSNAGSAISWSAGTKNIWLDIPAHYFQQNSQIREVSAAGLITQLSTDKVIVVENNAFASTTVNLLPSSASGIITIKDGLGYAGINNIILSPNGAQTIDGASSMTFDYNYQWAELAPIAAGWTVIG